jgi:hypothetical protein
MFDNPYFQYAGINNPKGEMPYIVNLANLNTTEAEVNLFNAQENLTAINRGLPEGVAANAEVIFEMTKAKAFLSCFQTAPLNGFPEQTKFQLVQDNAPNPDIITDMFQLKVDVLFDTAKILGAGYDGNKPLTQFYLFINSGRLNVSASAEGTGNLLRFIFSVTSMVNIKNRDIKEIRVENTTTYPCLDVFPLTKINTGFNNSDSSDAASYEEILATTNFSPLGIDHILIQSENIRAIAKNPITLTRKDANGNRDSKEIALGNSPYIRPNQRTIQAVSEINGSTELTFTIPPSTIVTLFIYAKNRMVL